MKKFILAFISLFLLWACHKKPEKIMDRQTYKQVLRDLILADLVSQNLRKNDSLKKQVRILVYKKYGVDSLMLKKTTDYYSSHPQQLTKIYAEIHTEFKRKADSLEKLAPHSKPKNDQIKMDKTKINLKNVRKKKS